MEALYGSIDFPEEDEVKNAEGSTNTSICLDISAHESGDDETDLASASSLHSSFTSCSSSREVSLSGASGDGMSSNNVGTAAAACAHNSKESLVSRRAVVAHLLKNAAWVERVLSRLHAFASRESAEGTLISGVAKLKNRLMKEKANAMQAAEAILLAAGGAMAVEEASHEEDCSRAPHQTISSGCLIARSNNLQNLDLVMHCLETEPDVTGVFVVAPPPLPSRAGVQSNSHHLRRGSAHNLEIDITSCGGLRWVKVRAASASSLRGEVEQDGAHKYLELMKEYALRASCTRLPFGLHPQVVTVFAEPPPRELTDHLQALGVKMRHCGGPPLPCLRYEPCCICLDTTALVALCSEACYGGAELHFCWTSGPLKEFTVLSGQVRAETEDKAVAHHIQNALRSHTRWVTPRALEEAMQAFVNTSIDKEDDASEELGWRQRYVPVALIKPDLTWVNELVNHLDGDELAVEDEDPFVVEVDQRRELRHNNRDSHGVEKGLDSWRDDLAPSWVVADITLHEFKWMIETIAGPREVQRAARVLRNVLVVNTEFLRKPPKAVTELAYCSHLVTPLQSLCLTGKISLRNLVVFGAADATHSILLTSNRQFHNGARQQRMEICAWFHPSRALIEQKVMGMRRRDGPRIPPPFLYGG